MQKTKKDSSARSVPCNDTINFTANYQKIRRFRSLSSKIRAGLRTGVLFFVRVAKF